MVNPFYQLGPFGNLKYTESFRDYQSMKRCPKCDSIFEGEKRFCPEDGTALIEELTEIPSDYPAELDEDGEFKTVVRSRPINYDIPDFPADQPQHHEAPPKEVVEAMAEPSPPPPTPKKSRRGLKIALALFAILFVGGALILGVAAGGYFYLQRQAEIAKAEKELAEREEAEKRESEAKDVTRDHTKRNSLADESKLNGKVIRAMVNVRSKPSRSSKRVDTIPRNDRLNIIRRESPTSPWYEIECEHGTKGWMHGNTIAFTR